MDHSRLKCPSTLNADTIENVSGVQVLAHASLGADVKSLIHTHAWLSF